MLFPTIFTDSGTSVFLISYLLRVEKYKYEVKKTGIYISSQIRLFLYVYLPIHKKEIEWEQKKLKV